MVKILTDVNFGEKYIYILYFKLTAYNIATQQVRYLSLNK